MNDPTPSWSAVPFFCVLSYKNDIRQKFRKFLCFSPRRTSPIQDSLIFYLDRLVGHVAFNSFFVVPFVVTVFFSFSVFVFKLSPPRCHLLSTRYQHLVCGMRFPSLLHSKKTRFPQPLCIQSKIAALPLSRIRILTPLSSQDRTTLILHAVLFQDCDRNCGAATCISVSSRWLHCLGFVRLTVKLSREPSCVSLQWHAHVRTARSQCPCVRTCSVGDVGDSHTQSSVRGTKHPLPQGCVIVSRPRNANPWMPTQGDPEARLSSPASTQTDPAPFPQSC